ncbi:MAG: hypothetical protein GVY26_19265 [Bacteroidetes bacterium]|jgi:hypothetical protein|nr:hypothetical protein [Bacteroidota bacterium]
MRHPSFLLLLLASCFVWGKLHAQRCSDNRPPFRGYSFLNPYLVGPQIPGSQLFVDIEELEEYYQQQGSPQIKGNVDEWHERFCEIPAVRDIAALVYQTTKDDLRELRSAIRNPSNPLGYLMRENSFATYLKRNECTETVDYLIYAKNCERYVTRLDPWERPQTMYREMDALIERGLDEFEQTKSHYIRLRYVYQIIRLAHYSRQYERVLKLHKRLLRKTDNDPSIIEDWIEGHRAGALMALGQRVEASYIFSRLFDRCPSKQTAYYHSFDIRTDQEWADCLALCRTPEEKATLYVIRANFPDSRLLVELENIYENDPSSPYLHLLLVREVRRLERDLLGLSFNNNRRQNKFYYGVPSSDAGRRVVDLQTFVTQVLKEGVIEDKALWRSMQGYLAMLAGNFYDARKSFEAARQLRMPRLLEEQLDAFELALYINTLEDIDKETENKLARLQRTNDVYKRLPDFEDFLRDKLTELYQQTDQEGKAFLMQYPFDYLKPNIKPKMVEELLRLCRLEEPSEMEAGFIADGDSTVLQQLLNMKASYLMKQYKFEAALETLKRMDRVDWDNFGQYNPFVDWENERVHQPLPSDVLTYNKGEFLEALLDKEYQAKAGTGNVGVLNFQIGLALYNITYFGQAWQVQDFYRSGASLRTAYLRDGDNVVPHPVYPYGNAEHFDCSRARLFFERARLATDSLELGAQATFWAAKCERNEYYVNRWRPGAQQTFENFELLVENYRNTDYYQRILEECLYFRAYASQ